MKQEFRAIVTSEGRRHDRSALATVRALARAGRQTLVAYSRPRSLAAASRFAAHTQEVPASSSSSFRLVIEELTDSWSAGEVFATSDAALEALSPETAALMDKVGLAEAATAVGLETPETFAFTSLAELAAVKAELGTSVIVKPTRKEPGGQTALRIDRDEVVDVCPIVAGLAQPYYSGEMSSVSGVVWDGELVATLQQRYVRTFPAEAGTSSYAMTESVDQERVGRLKRMLESHHGIFQAQFVEGLLIDLNRRPYGSMPLARAAGLNLPDIVCRLRQGESVPFRTAAVGVRYRWLDGDVRSLLSDVRAGRRSLAKAAQDLWPHAGTCHSVFSLTDPRPWLVRAWPLSGSADGR